MILVDFSTVIDHGAFKSGNLPNGDRLFWMVATNEAVAIKYKDGTSVCAYYALSEQQMKELTQVEFLGGILVSQRGLTFRFDDMLNEARWTAKLNELHGRFTAALDKPAPPNLPEPIKPNGHALTAEELAQVQPVRPDLTREQLVVK